jgi:hypothetical protein
MMGEHAGKAVIGALAGAVLGWAGAALTTVGRVDAIERTLQRIESRLDGMVIAKPVHTITTQEPRDAAAPTR